MPKLPPKKAEPLKYRTGDPTEIGVYACRVPFASLASHLQEDMFLMWMDDRWYYITSDLTYRGEVLGWIGPLPRTRGKG